MVIGSRTIKGVVAVGIECILYVLGRLMNDPFWFVLAFQVALFCIAYVYAALKPTALTWIVRTLRKYNRVLSYSVLALIVVSLSVAVGMGSNALGSKLWKTGGFGEPPGNRFLRAERVFDEDGGLYHLIVEYGVREVPTGIGLIVFDFGRYDPRLEVEAWFGVPDSPKGNSIIHYDIPKWVNPEPLNTKCVIYADDVLVTSQSSFFVEFTNTSPLVLHECYMQAPGSSVRFTTSDGSLDVETIAGSDFDTSPLRQESLLSRFSSQIRYACVFLILVLIASLVYASDGKLTRVSGRLPTSECVQEPDFGGRGIDRDWLAKDALEWIKEQPQHSHKSRRAIAMEMTQMAADGKIRVWAKCKPTWDDVHVALPREKFYTHILYFDRGDDNGEVCRPDRIEDIIDDDCCRDPMVSRVEIKREFGSTPEDDTRTARRMKLIGEWRSMLARVIYWWNNDILLNMPYQYDKKVETEQVIAFIQEQQEFQSLRPRLRGWDRLDHTVIENSGLHGRIITLQENIDRLEQEWGLRENE